MYLINKDETEHTGQVSQNNSLYPCCATYYLHFESFGVLQGNLLIGPLNSKWNPFSMVKFQGVKNGTGISKQALWHSDSQHLHSDCPVWSWKCGQDSNLNNFTQSPNHFWNTVSAVRLSLEFAQIYQFLWLPRSYLMAFSPCHLEQVETLFLLDMVVQHTSFEAYQGV